MLERVEDIGRSGVTASELARHFPTPLLSLVGDEVADGQLEVPEGEPRPLSLFDAVRVDYSLRRLVHYTGSDWRNVQQWILLTNYHRYVDQFVRWGLAQLAERRALRAHGAAGQRRDRTRHASAEAEDARLPRSAWHRFQMPAYHLIARDGQGVTLVNIGVGPSNAKNITDHLAVLRPQLLADGRPLRRPAAVAADRRLRAGARLSAPGPHPRRRWCRPTCRSRRWPRCRSPCRTRRRSSPASTGEALKRRLRTGTVVTNDDRNWELRYTQERRRINLSRAIAVDMESGTVAANGYRLRVPYGTLLCVSDKPLHGEIKLPGAANAFYESAVAQHLEIGLKALDLLRERRDTLHSRKLRSFDEPPFR